MNFKKITDLFYFDETPYSLVSLLACKQNSFVRENLKFQRSRPKWWYAHNNKGWVIGSTTSIQTKAFKMHCSF